MISGLQSLITKPNRGVMIDMAHPLSRGLYGCWLFNEGAGSLAQDISGRGNHGTLANMSPNTPGSGWGSSVFGGGLQFDGLTDYVDCGDINSLDGASQFTFSAWVKPITLGVWKRVCSKDKSPDGNEGIVMSTGGVGYGDSNDAAVILHPPGSDWALGHTTGDILVVGEWHHWGMVFDGTKTGDAARLKFFFDGVQQSLTFAGVSIPATTPVTSYPVRFGEQNDTDHNGLDCVIDNIYMYNRALSAEEMRTLHHDPFCNLLHISSCYVPAGHVFIPVAMCHYRQQRIA